MAWVQLSQHSISIPIKPDYGAPVEKVYTDFTTADISSTKDLTILAFCRGCRHPDSESCPSWVLDWRWSDREPHPLCSFSYGREDPRKIFSAGGAKNCDPLFDDQSNLLGLWGLHLDTVTDISSADELGDTWRTFSQLFGQGVIVQGLLQAVQFLKKHIAGRKLYDIDSGGIYKPTGQPIIDAYWQTLQATDEEWEREANIPRMREEFHGPRKTSGWR